MLLLSFISNFFCTGYCTDFGIDETKTRRSDELVRETMGAESVASSHCLFSSKTNYSRTNNYPRIYRLRVGLCAFTNTTVCLHIPVCIIVYIYCIYIHIYSLYILCIHK